jgi:hypothetical protein
MYNEFKVLTCLACGKRLMFEPGYEGNLCIQVRHKKGCDCRATDYIISHTLDANKARKLAETPLRSEFRNTHTLLRSKLKVIDYFMDLIKTCNDEITQAEIEGKPEVLKEVENWLSAIGIAGSQEGKE